MIQYPVGVALAEVPVNVAALIDDTDFKTREESVVYNQAGMDLVWNFVTSAGAFTQTAVTPTTAGVHDWTSQTNGMYTLEIPASGGTINNDSIGFGWFTGFATGIVPWCGPIVSFGLDIVVNTTIATLATQTGFTLTDGSTDNDAYNGWLMVVRDAATGAQRALGLVSDYVGSTKTVTLDADPGIFTMAVGDYVTLLPQYNGLSTQQKADVNAEADTAVSDYFGAAINDDINDASATASSFTVTTSQGAKILVGVLRLTSGALSGEARLVHWTGTTVETLDPDTIPAGLGEGGPFSAAPADNVTFTFIPLS